MSEIEPTPETPTAAEVGTAPAPEAAESAPTETAVEVAAPAGDAAPAVRAAPATPVVPAADLVQTADGWRLTLDMPGVAAADLDVHVERGVLEVRGTTPTVIEDGLDTRFGFRGRREYRRRIPVGDEVDAAAVTAEMKAGVLTIGLPKVTPPAHRIRVVGG